MVTRSRQVEPGTSKRTDDLFADLDHAKRRRGCCSVYSCGLLLLLLIVGSVIGLVAAVAATGIIDVPVVSGIVYPEHPAPIRDVASANGGSFEDIPAQKITPQAASVQSISVRVGEEELTNLLREPNRDGKVLLKQGQLAIEQDHAELYGHIIPERSNERPLVVRAVIVPTPDRTAVRVESVRLGYVPLPVGVAAWVIRTISGFDPISTTTLSRYGIERVDLERGAAVLTLGPTFYETLLKHEE